MDLIYTNANREDIGVLQDYELDLAFGADENNFECRIQAQSHCCEDGSLLYIDGTEYGGIVDSVGSITEDKEVIYSGRTWHGILNSKIIEPDEGESHLILSGEINALIGTLIERLTLSDLYASSSEDSGFTVENFKVDRYIGGYDGIAKMCESVGAKLRFTFDGSKVILSAVAAVDYSKDEEFDSDVIDFEITKRYNAVNHLICLGSGELENRLVVHLYADADGKISETQTFFGLDEYSATYDYSAVESEEELIKEGKKRFKELRTDSISLNINETEDLYDVGDIIGATDNITGISVADAIAKKIVTIQNGQITINYKVGE